MRTRSPRRPPASGASPPDRASRRAAAVAVVLALAACSDGPFEIEPRELAGSWAGTTGTARVSLRCAEEVDRGYDWMGQATTSYRLGCRGSFLDPGRGIDVLSVYGGTSQNSRARQPAGLTFGVLVSDEPRAATSLHYTFEGMATDRQTVEGWLVLVRRQGTVFPNGNVGGPETYTRSDSTRLTLRRQ